MTLDEAIAKAQHASKGGYVQHVNAVSRTTADYVVSDWYDAELTIVSFENGRQL